MRYLLFVFVEDEDSRLVVLLEGLLVDDDLGLELEEEELLLELCFCLL